MAGGLIQAAELYVKQELQGNDGSHDWFHIARVRSMALKLAKEEKVDDSEELLAVELSALLHDIKDWKYSGSETAGRDAVEQFLKQHGCSSGVIRTVLFVVENIGFKTELGQLEKQKKRKQPTGDMDSTHPKKTKVSADNTSSSSTSALDHDRRILAVVQDADRLDAVGAIGIARTFSYGGARNRALYDPDHPFNPNLTKEQYMKDKKGATINHFHEKLLKLKDMMKTAAGRKKAQQRHEYMEQFLEQFHAEWNAQR